MFACIILHFHAVTKEEKNKKTGTGSGLTSNIEAMAVKLIQQLVKVPRFWFFLLS